MGFYDAAIQAALSGQTVRAAHLVYFDFLTTDARLWLGTGDLSAMGQTWQGTAGLLSASSIEEAIGGTAPEVTFRLSGVDPAMLARALDASDEVKGRPVTIYELYFNDAWQELSPAVAVFSGIMDVMRVKADADSSTRIIEVTAENLFARRASPAWGWLSDRDQKRRYPGPPADRGLEQIATMANKTVLWPVFPDTP